MRRIRKIPPASNLAAARIHRVRAFFFACSGHFPSIPDSAHRASHPRCGGRRSNFVAAILAVAVVVLLSFAAFAGDIRVRGAIVGRVESDGAVRLRGSIVGRFEPNGDIRVRGSLVGRIESGGHIRKKGNLIGQVEANGDVRKNGSIIGRIETDGDVRDHGSIVGRTEEMTKEQAAVLFFFDFFAVR
jgi:cytoskeletal protein CcmA (bactofilin family)